MISGIPGISSVLDKCLLGASARINYNLELYRFFTKASPEEATDFWRSISPVFLDEQYASMRELFPSTVKSETARYIKIKSSLMHEANQYDEMDLLNICITLKATASSIKWGEEIAINHFDSALKKQKLSASKKQKLIHKFKDVLEESCYINEVAENIKQYLLNLYPGYEDFLATISYHPANTSGQANSIYNPELFSNKLIKLVNATKEQYLSVQNHITLEQKEKLSQRLTSLWELLQQNIEAYPSYAPDTSTLENTRLRFEDFHALYELKSAFVQLKRDLSNAQKLESYILKQAQSFSPPSTVHKKPQAKKTKRAKKSIPQQAHIELEVEQAPEAEIDVDDDSTGKENISVDTNVEQVTNRLTDLSIKVKVTEEPEVIISSPALTIIPPSYQPQWQAYQISEPSSLAQKLKKHRALLDALFDGGTLHKRFNFKELTQLIIDAGGKIINGKGSRRRIIIQECASDTLQPTEALVKSAVHAPHGKHKTSDPLPAAIVKHFVCVLEKAHITPEFLWPEPSFNTVISPKKYV